MLGLLSVDGKGAKRKERKGKRRTFLKWLLVAVVLSHSPGQPIVRTQFGGPGRTAKHTGSVPS